MSLDMTIRRERRSAAVVLTGELDHYTAADLVAAVTELLAAAPALTDLRLDCTRLTHCDTAGLSGLLLIHRRTGAAAVELHLDHRPPALDRLLTVTGTLEHLTRPPHRHGDPGATGSSEAG
ncbi:STAS domain-containing protein [Nocardia blacklockiae]|uniref:STAS domain-containing protein n=1 Tax=Nocardia blacklockiae TaxID=480036 RepID=UPI0018959EC3|nr:STAS domain-containing protein [Nocardia blacklockiae]MBF6170974.1 STAS domain-containing protein [Nocardia blacklockiae]